MTQSDLQSLFTRPERADRSILSVYLNVDPSQQPNRNREFEKALKSMMLSIRSAIHDTTESEQFATAAGHIEDFVSAYEPGSRGLAIFFDCLDGFFWHQELGISIQNQIRWERELFTQPLANALDQFDRYGVVLADRTRLRLFIVFHGAIEEFTREGLTTNTRMQQFIKEVDWLVQTKHAHHLALAGPADVTSELRTLLPKRLALRVVGTASVSIDAATSELLTAMLTIAEDYERNTELQTVQEIVRAAGNEKTVAGLGRTLKAINAGRVGELIYSEGFRSPGLECSNCAALFSSEKDACASCGGILQPVADVVERAVERVRQTGANVEMVTGEASASLNSVGGIGAFLKAKSVSIRA